MNAWIRRCALVALLFAAACTDGHRDDVPGAGSTAGAGGTVASTIEGPRRPPPCPLKPGSKFAPDTRWDGTYVELCNDWDDDCDGVVDEGFDKDGDGYSPCETASELPADCDDTKPNVNQGFGDLCDGLDNDCDGAWDEDEDQDAGCPTPRCSSARGCPGDLVCIFRDEPCAERAQCPEIPLTGTTCEAPEPLFYPGVCDPSTCVRWQDGTCWGDCVCAEDGQFRWRFSCTE